VPLLLCTKRTRMIWGCFIGGILDLRSASVPIFEPISNFNVAVKCEIVVDLIFANYWYRIQLLELFGAGVTKALDGQFSLKSTSVSTS
jgi:hypothetical protein